MEAVIGRGGPVPMSSSQPPRKEWRAVPEHCFPNNEPEEGEHANLGQSDERTIYEEGARQLDVEFCSITIDGGGQSDDVLQQRLQEIARQREELHRIEVELRARAIARSEVLGVRSGYESRMKEHVDAASKLKEQLQDREHYILELKMKLEVQDRELRAVKIDNEAAWAKEDLLREQNKELTTFRRERDNSEAERAQHLKKIHELQERIQEKDNQYLALEEQHRAVQETIFYKDEQLREAQAWISRAHEMDALHATTNQSLQAEIREHIEQFNQCWIGFHRQFADMEQHHGQAMKQLQLELAEAKERNGVSKDGSQLTSENSRNNTYTQNNGNPINLNGGGASNDNSSFMSNGNLDSAPSSNSASNAHTKSEQVSGVKVVPSSMLGINTFLPPGQMTALHPFIIHPQGVPHLSSTNAPNLQSHGGHFHPMSTTSVQQWQIEQEASNISLVSNQNKYEPSQTAQKLLRSDDPYRYQQSVERQVVHPDYLNTSVAPHQRSDPIINDSSDEIQVISEVLESNGNQYQVSQESQEMVNANLQFHASLGNDPQAQKSELKVQDENTVTSINQLQEQGLTSRQQWSGSSAASIDVGNHPLSSNDVSFDGTQTTSSLMAGNTMEPTLLDERSLLACIVRAIPAGTNGRIRISTTLPNRLGKMLSPLHWHDYKKYYGKLDDFVAHHPELFVIEGDFIHLREGAQEIISATTAYAKVAAAAAASSAPYSSLLPSIAVTPVAQNSRPKKTPSVDSNPPTSVLSTKVVSVAKPVDPCDRRSQISKVNHQQPNGVSFNIIHGLKDLNVSSQSKDLQELNCLSSGLSPGHSSVYMAVGNGANLDRASLGPSQSRGLSNGRHGFGGKQQGRSSGAGLISRRPN